MMEATVTKLNFLWSLLSILFFMCIGTFSDIGRMPSQQNHFESNIESQFTTKNNTRVVAQKGGLAILPCVVKLNSPATVSWIRRKDFQLLTVGLSTHSSDKRFLVEHARHMGHWSLRIKSVNEEDHGFYECQLSIYPTQSIFIELNVVEAVAEIASTSDLYIDEGSTLRLECKVKRATENPAFVFWYHNSKMVNYNTQDGFLVTSSNDNFLAPIDNNAPHTNGRQKIDKQPANGSSHTNKNKNDVTTSTDDKRLSNMKPYSNNNDDKSNLSNYNKNYNNNHSVNYNIKNSKYQFNKFGSSDITNINSKRNNLNTKKLSSTTKSIHSSLYVSTSISKLTIQEVYLHHAGNYTCAPSNARSASISVHVLRGEKPAAMQHLNHSIFENECSNCSIVTTFRISTNKASTVDIKRAKYDIFFNISLSTCLFNIYYSYIYTN
ncbi:probable serine/threonine-protein kinase roco9, partial [Teleopsis dalmanni]|uniref:probable serine/threonine-protein kinase roco9 n=1 Tax=Teleopsis dalmanni TaxID=139649 RepID=UPI0018CD1661